MKSKKDQEIEIVQKAIDGCMGSFGYLYGKYFNKLVKILRKYTVNMEDAEDLVSEAFIRAHKNINTLRIPEAFFSWVVKTAFRVLMDESKRHNQTVGPFATDFFVIQTLVLYEKETAYHNLLDTVKVSETHKQILDWHYIQEMSVKEIADILGSNSNAVHVRLHRARQVVLDYCERVGLDQDFFEKDF